MALRHGAANRLAAVGAVCHHRDDWTRSLVEQVADFGGTAGLLARQFGREDLASAGIGRGAEFAPRPPAELAVLPHQPLARAANLKPVASVATWTGPFAWAWVSAVASAGPGLRRENVVRSGTPMSTPSRTVSGRSSPCLPRPQA